MSHKPVPVLVSAGAADASGMVDEWWTHAPAHDLADQPPLKGTAGEGIGAVNGARALQELRQVEREQRFLAAVGEAFASSLDYRETLHMVAHMAVGSIADLCLVDVIREDGRLERVAAEDAGAEEEALKGAWDEALQDSQSPSVAEALSSERVRVFSPLPTTAGDPLFESLLRLGVTWLIIAPMVAREQRVGVILLGLRRGGPAEEERAAAVASELARRAALAIDNARLYDEARRAVQARDQMLSVVAHDLRNPLGVIRMAAELIEELGELNPYTVQERLRMIRRSADQMNRLIDDLLDLSRIEAGRLHVEQRLEDPGEIVAEAVSMLRPLADRASLTLVSAVEQSLPPIIGDRARILQAIGNLVGNAIKFTPAPGQITLFAERAADGVRFGVRDTGRGIEPQQLPYLFDRFWQATSADRRGLGLGLAIVKGIVDAHEGRVWAESAPGKGTTISFTIRSEP